MAGDGGTAAILLRRHLIAGWLLLLLFVVMGAVLEAFHGFKVGWYVNVSQATRRLMLTLSHAHGVLLGLLNLAFAQLAHLRPSDSPRRNLASACLLGASVLLPGGFLLGGIVIHEGDPGIGIFLTPVGAALLVVAIFLALRDAAASD